MQGSGLSEVLLSKQCFMDRYFVLCMLCKKLYCADCKDIFTYTLNKRHIVFILLVTSSRALSILELQLAISLEYKSQRFANYTDL
jgi:hypothetical protein